jgi:hypothetical protein
MSPSGPLRTRSDARLQSVMRNKQTHADRLGFFGLTLSQKISPRRMRGERHGTLRFGRDTTQNAGGLVRRRSVLRRAEAEVAEQRGDLLTRVEAGAGRERHATQHFA